MESPDEVLPRRNVDRRLAADRAVNLGQERRRDLDEIASAIDDRRRKARKVANDPAAERYDVILTFDAQLKKPIDDRSQTVPALAALARRDEDRFDSDAVQPRAQPLTQRLPDSLVAHHQQTAIAREWTEIFGCTTDQAVFDQDVITARAE